MTIPKEQFVERWLGILFPIANSINFDQSKLNEFTKEELVTALYLLLDSCNITDLGIGDTHESKKKCFAVAILDKLGFIEITRANLNRAVYKNKKQIYFEVENGR